MVPTGAYTKPSIINLDKFSLVYRNLPVIRRDKQISTSFRPIGTRLCKDWISADQFKNKSMKFKDKIGLGLVILALVLFLWQNAFWKHKKMDNGYLKIGQNELKVEIANDDKGRYKGLSGHQSLTDDEGMLFVHQNYGQHQYVMRGMTFDLDFIFIKDSKVVDIAKNVSKEYKGVIKGATGYNKILEVSAGWVDKHGVKIGDEVVVSQ